MTVPATAPAPPRRGRHVLSVRVGDETVLYDPVGDALHLLDPVSSAVWDELHGDSSLEELSHRLALLAHAEVGRVRADVRRLLAQLRTAGVLDVDPPGPEQARLRAAGDPDADDDQPSWAASGPVPAMATPHRTSSFRALHHHFRVETNLVEVCEWVDTVLVDLATPAAAQHHYTMLDLGPGHESDRYLLGFDGELVARSGWLARILSLLLWHVNTETAKRSADAYVLVHAAAATNSGGGAVLLPAPMERGKTTTVAALVGAGWQYVTDEMVALDPVSLDVVAYPRPMSIDRGSWEVLSALRPPHAERIAGQWQVPASSIRAGSVASGGSPVAVVAPRYRAGSNTSLRRVSPGQLVVDLVDSTFAFRVDPRRNLETLAELARRVPGYRLTIGRLDHALALIDLAGRG